MAARAATAERMLDSAWRHSERPYEEVRLAAVAADAGVSVQTLHAQFGTKDQLFVAAWARTIGPEGVRRDAAPVGDVRTAVLAEEDRIPAIRELTESGRAWHREWVERTFAPLLDGLSAERRERRLTAIVVATDLLVWKLLRREMGLDREKAQRVVVDMVDATKGMP